MAEKSSRRYVNSLYKFDALALSEVPQSLFKSMKVTWSWPCRFVTGLDFKCMDKSEYLAFW